MFPAHRKIVIVAGLVVLVAAGCARSTSSGVRRIELIPADRSEASTIDAAESPTAVRSSAALSSLNELANRGASETSSDAPAESDGPMRQADEQFIALVGAALSASDLCALWDTLSLVPLDARVPAALAQQMQLVTEIMELSNEIVPGLLRDEWSAVAEGFDEVAGHLAEGRADRAGAAYDDPEFASAQGEIAGWMATHCG